MILLPAAVVRSRKIEYVSREYRTGILTLIYILQVPYASFACISTYRYRTIICRYLKYHTYVCLLITHLVLQYVLQVRGLAKIGNAVVYR